MFHVVLHIYVTTSEDFQTEWAEEIFRVLMDTSEMCLHFREEWGPEIAHLWKQVKQTVSDTELECWCIPRQV